MKPGLLTTEFWITVVINGWAVLGHALPPGARAAVIAVATAAYSLARALVKLGDRLNVQPQAELVGPAGVVTTSSGAPVRSPLG